MGKASEHTHQICLASRKRRSLRTRTDRSGNTCNNPRLSKMTQVPLQHHPQVDRNTQPPPQGQQQYFYPPPPPGSYMYSPPPPLQQHIPQPSQIIVQQDPDTAAALQQMAQLHQQHFETSQNRQKLSRTVPHPLPPLWVAFPFMMEKTRMHVLNGYKDLRRLVSTLATTSDQYCCRDPPKMWQKSYNPWMKNSHMTS